MTKSPDKVPITIEVEPEITAITTAFLKGILPVLMEMLFEEVPPDKIRMYKDNNYDGRMYAALDEIYKKCMRNVYFATDEKALFEMVQLPAKILDNNKIIN